MSTPTKGCCVDFRPPLQAGFPTFNEQSQWSPQPYISPCFQHFRAEEVTVRALTKTQVELFHKKRLTEALLQQAATEQAAWSRARSELEDQLRALHVRNAEAERLFKRELKDVSEVLASTNGKLAQLSDEHKQLKSASSGKVAELQDRVTDLQLKCDELERARQSLQRQLRDATVEAEQRREAEQRVAELESAIQATKERAQRLIADMQAQRDGAEAEKERLHQQLTGTQQALVDEARARSEIETNALHLAIDRQRLAAALEVERLINEPLRHTNHASTTLAHAMRSVAAPTLADRSRTPLHSTYAMPPSPHRHAPDAVAVQRPAAFSPMATKQQQQRPRSAVSAPFSPGPSPQQLHVARPGLQNSLEGSTLTRLGRAWATTTPTAGHPHPTFLDNIARYEPVYASQPRGAVMHEDPVYRGVQSPSARPRSASASVSHKRAGTPSSSRVAGRVAAAAGLRKASKGSIPSSPAKWHHDSPVSSHATLAYGMSPM